MGAVPDLASAAARSRADTAAIAIEARVLRSGRRFAQLPVMYRVCISVVDSTRARLFTFDRTVDGAGLHEALVERTDLVNTDRRPVARDQHLDEHRGYHLAKQDAEFARTAMAALRELVDEHAPQRVVMCAGPRMLGNLRASAPGILPEHLPLDELARDLVKLTPPEVHDQLASHGLLPRPLVGLNERLSIEARNIL